MRGAGDLSRVRKPDPQPRPTLSARTVAWLALGAVVLSSAGYLTGRRRVEEDQKSSARVAQQEPASAPARDASKSTAPTRKLERPFLIRPPELFVAVDAQQERQYLAQQAKDLVNLVRSHVSTAERWNPTGDPVASANSSYMFMRGWLEALVRTAPDLVDDLAAEVERSMCSQTTSAAELITMSRMVELMPELANAKAFDCVLANHPQEGIVLWSVLDAWKSSGLPESEGIAQVEASATDPLTRRRFMSREDIAREAAAMADDDEVIESQVLTTTQKLRFTAEQFQTQMDRSALRAEP